MSKVTTYRVKISKRKNGDAWRHYRWQVDVDVDDKYVGDYEGGGWTRTAEQAKKKALRHIYKCEKEIPNTQFGVVLDFTGTFSEVEEALLR